MSFLRSSCLFLCIIPRLCWSGGGVVHFTGRIVEATCAVQSNSQIDKLDATLLNTCSHSISTGAKVTTQLVEPDRHLVTWRADDTSKPDASVTRFKVISITYS